MVLGRANWACSAFKNRRLSAALVSRRLRAIAVRLRRSCRTRLMRRVSARSAGRPRFLGRIRQVFRQAVHWRRRPEKRRTLALQQVYFRMYRFGTREIAGMPDHSPDEKSGESTPIYQPN